MIVDTNKLVNVKNDGMFLTGESAEASKVLKQGERVVLASGVRSFIEGVQRHFPKPQHNGTSASVEEDDDFGDFFSSMSGRFHEFNTYQDMLQVFLKDPQSLVKFDKAEMKPSDWFEQGNELEYDVTGDFIDIGRHMEGIPEVFGSLHNGNPRNRRIRIIVDNGNAGGVSTEDIRHRSERIVRLIDGMESARIRSELLAIDASECSYTEVIVKQFNEGLDLEDVAVATHPEFLRRLCFRVAEHSQTYESGYGSSLWLIQRRNVLKSTSNDEATIYIQPNMRSKGTIDREFDNLEKELVEEMSQPVPKLSLFILGSEGLQVEGL